MSGTDIVSDNTPRRFSDEELIDLHSQVIDLSHRFESHKNDEAQKFDAVIRAIQDNTESTRKLAEETRGVVRFQRDIAGTVRVGKSAQSFAIWLTKWGAIGLGIVAAIKWLKDFIGV